VARAKNNVLVVGTSLPFRNLRSVSRLPRGARVTELAVG
jgi:hypothetical protein